MSNVKVFKVGGVILDYIDDFIDEGLDLPEYLEETRVIYNRGTKKYLDRKNKEVWIEHRGRAFKYKDCTKEYYQSQWELNNISDRFILPERLVTALETVSKSHIYPDASMVNKTLEKHYNSKRCRDLRRGVR